MKRHILAVMAFGLLVAFGATACEKGPLEKVGRNIDKAVKDLKQ